MDDGTVEQKQKRRGRQSILASELGDNDFVVTEADIDDMVSCLRARLRTGPTSIPSAYEYYLAGAFRRRHPHLHMQYVSGKRSEPVTLRQYRYYLTKHARLSDELAANMRQYVRNRGHLGSVIAAGPGEVYEIDSTGGRINLVANRDGGQSVLLGRPTIYLIIDRWSRFVVSAYISLRPPSYEEVRHALLVAFTSRERRFTTLGVNIDDKRWPVGRMPAVLCPDRGADFMSESMEQSVVNDLRIELTPLPPYCPDGKAIVERLIREIKRRMAASGMAGVYAERPMDPHSKRAARKAEVAAVHALADAYRKLIEIVVDHNNRPHSALKRRRVLAQAGVRPCPTDAYLWGLQNISGLRTAPFSDQDYKRLLLSSDTANIASGVLRYRQRPYLPMNEPAIDLAARSSKRAKQVDIRVDKTAPHEVFVVTHQGHWAAFQLTRGGESEVAGLTLDEEEALSSQTALLWARSEHESRIERVVSQSKNKATKRPHHPATKIDKAEQLSARAQETAAMKKSLTGEQTQPVVSATSPMLPATKDWMQIEEEERLRNLDLIRRHRSKR